MIKFTLSFRMAYFCCRVLRVKGRPKLKNGIVLHVLVQQKKI